MKNFDFIQSANESIKVVANNLREANREYTSISQVLKDIQRKPLMKLGYAKVFASLGLRTDGKVKPANFFNALQPEQWKTVTTGKGENKKEEKKVGLWGWSQKKDSEGKKVFEEDGVTPVMEPVLRTISAWTPNKVFKVIAQANALKEAAK